MNEDQEELFGQYVAEFALAHDLKLDDDDILKVVDLFDECTERWKTDVSVSIAEMANDLGFTEQDDHIMEMVSFVGSECTQTEHWQIKSLQHAQHLEPPQSLLTTGVPFHRSCDHRYVVQIGGFSMTR